MRLLAVILVVVAITVTVVTLSGRGPFAAIGDRVTWGEPLVDEVFSDNGWRQRWALHQGDFSVRAGRLVSVDERDAVAIFKQSISGPMAIEFNGMMEPGAQPGDLSVVWYGDVTLDELGKVATAKAIYRLQVGAYDNTAVCIIGPDGGIIAYQPWQLDPLKPVRLRYELIETRLRILVDGVAILEHELPLPIPAGWIGLYGYYAGKVFDDVRVYQRRIDERLPATAVGDHLAQHGQYLEAAREYARVADGLGSSPLGHRARWLRAVCLERAKDPAASAAWAALKDTAYAEHAALAMINSCFEREDHQGTQAKARELAGQASPAIRNQLAAAWAGWIRSLRAKRATPELLGSYADLHAELFREVMVADREAAELLLYLRRPRDVVDRFSDLPDSHGRALLQLGRAEDALRILRERPVAQIAALRQLKRHEEALTGPPWSRPMGLAALGRWEELLLDYPEARVSHALCLQKLGRYEYLIAEYSDVVPVTVDCLLALGRIDEAEALVGEDESLRFILAMRLGRTDEALTLAQWDPVSVQRARWAAAFAAWGAGDAAGFAELSANPIEGIWDNDELGTTAALLLPIRAALDGGPDAVPAIRAALAPLQEPWTSTGAKWMNALGGTEPPDGDDLLPALWHDLAGERELARAAYQEWSQIGRLGGSDLRAAFVRARLQLLAD